MLKIPSGQREWTTQAVTGLTCRSISVNDSTSAFYRYIVLRCGTNLYKGL